MSMFLAVEGTEPALRLVPPLAPQFADPAKYHAPDGLAAAMDAAMLIGIPLLLTGEPGTGKTSAAEWLALELGGARLLRYDVKSTSTGRDLLYSFDEVARFRDGAKGTKVPLIEYIQFNALGEAIIRAAGGQAKLACSKRGAEAETAQRAFGIADPAVMVAASLLPNDADFRHAPPEHCVVLIDELDKAPRDTPNDLLAEVAQMAFAISELGISVGHRESADAPAPRPIVVITSNSEKGLPEPFLRRCAYFDIPPPNRGTLATIVGRSFPSVTASSEIFLKAHEFYERLRAADWIRKRPGTAELLAWIGRIVGPARGDKPVTFDRETARGSLGCVLKNADDLKEGNRLFDAWRG